jgi:hypothetical protein
MVDPKTEAWRTAAHGVITELAKANTHIVSDMVISALEAANLGLNNYSSLGGVFKRAANAGLIVKTDEAHPGNRKSHSAKIVWKSLVYSNGVKLSPELDALGALITLTLGYNAATIRHASMVFAGGPIVDGKQLEKHIKVFNRIQDDFNSETIKAIERYEKAAGRSNAV